MNLENARMPFEPVRLDYLDPVVAASEPQSGAQRPIFDQFRRAAR
jgi:hypothetical protein